MTFSNSLILLIMPSVVIARLLSLCSENHLYNSASASSNIAPLCLLFVFEFLLLVSVVRYYENCKQKSKRLVARLFCLAPTTARLWIKSKAELLSEKCVLLNIHIKYLNIAFKYSNSSITITKIPPESKTTRSLNMSPSQSTNIKEVSGTEKILQKSASF